MTSAIVTTTGLAVRVRGRLDIIAIIGTAIRQEMTEQKAIMVKDQVGGYSILAVPAIILIQYFVPVADVSASCYKVEFVS